MPYKLEDLLEVCFRVTCEKGKCFTPTWILLQSALSSVDNNINKIIWTAFDNYMVKQAHLNQEE